MFVQRVKEELLKKQQQQKQNNIGFDIIIRTGTVDIGRKNKRLLKLEEERNFIGRKVYGL